MCILAIKKALVHELRDSRFDSNATLENSGLEWSMKVLHPKPSINSAITKWFPIWAHGLVLFKLVKLQIYVNTNVYKPFYEHMAVSYRDQAVVYRPRSVVRLWKYLVLVLYCLVLFSENLWDRVCHVFLLNGLKADFWTRKIANTMDMWHPNRLHLKHSSRNGSKSVWRSTLQREPFQFQGGYKVLFIIRSKRLKLVGNWFKLVGPPNDLGRFFFHNLLYNQSTHVAHIKRQQRVTKQELLRTNRVGGWE